MKKISLTLLIVAALICALAISVAASEFGAVTTVDGFTTVDGLDTTSRVLMSDGITYPSAYIFKSKTSFDFATLSSATGKEYTASSVVMLEVPEGCTYLQRDFAGSQTLEYIYISSTVTGYQWATFNGCTNLTTVEFAENSTVTAIKTDAFYATGISVLKLPNSLQEISDNFLRACPNLTTIYFGENFANIFKNRAPVAGCPNLKTLYVPAGIFDENGNISLNPTFFGWNDRDSAFTKGGVIYYTGTKSQAEKIISTERELYQSSYSNPSDYNTAVWWVIQAVSVDEFNALTAEEKANGCYMVYDYSKCEAFYSGKHKELTAINGCQYGCARCGEAVVIENPQHDLKLTTTTAESGYFGDISIVEACKSCGTKTIEETVSPLFTWKGYTVATFGKTYSMAQGFTVNNEAVAKYMEYVPSFEYGLIAAGNISGEAFSPDLNTDYCIPQGKIAHDSFDIKITGISSEHINSRIVFCVYVKTDEAVYYLDNNTSGKTLTGISYKELKPSAE